MDTQKKYILLLATVGLALAVAAWSIIATSRHKHDPVPSGVHRPSETVEAEVKQQIPLPAIKRHEVGTLNLEPPLVSLSVAVVDFEGNPIANAECSIVIEDSISFLGVSNSEGKLMTKVNASSVGEIIAVAQGFSSSNTPFSVSNSNLNLRIVMSLGGSISGTVHPPEGGLLEDCWVVAFQSSRELKAADAPMIMGGDPRFHVANVESSGSFKIEGLDPQLEYSVLAAGAGYTTRKRVPPIQPSQVDIDLFVLPIFGVLVELVEADGTPITKDLELNSYPAGNFSTREKSVSYLPPESLAAYLAGVRIEKLDLGGGSREVFLFTAEDERDEVGPVVHLIRVPGYEALRAEVTVPRLTGSISLQTLQLVSNTATRGRLQIKFDGFSVEGEGDYPHSLLPVGTVYLRRDNEEVYQVNVGHFSNEVKAIEGLPAGLYEAWFTTSNRYFRYPRLTEETITLEVGLTPERLIIPIHELGTIEVVFHSGEGDLGVDAAGSMSCLVRPLEWLGDNNSGGQMGFVPMIFESPPYLVEGLPPGRYLVKLLRPFTATLGEDGIDVIVSRSSVTPVAVNIPQ